MLRYRSVRWVDDTFPPVVPPLICKFLREMVLILVGDGNMLEIESNLNWLSFVISPVIVILRVLILHLF